MTAKSYHPTSLVEQALDERWYGDGPPLWKEGRNCRPCKRSDEAFNERRQAIRLLERHAESFDGASALARRLGQCAPKRRCKSGACPECVRALQRWHVASMADCLRGVVGEIGGGDLIAVSIVSSPDLIAVGAAISNPFKKLKRRLRAALKKAGIDFAIGGFDISRNEHIDGAFAQHWAPQAWLFLRADDWRKGRSALRRAFPSSELVSCPVRGQVYDGNLAGLAYALKGEFARRVTLPGDDEARQDTTLRRLRPAQKVSIYLSLDEAGLPARIFIRGAKVMATMFGTAIVPDKRFRRQIEKAEGAQRPRQRPRRNPAPARKRPIS